MSEKSIMVNLGDEKVKQIGEVIGNKTCNKILDYLGDNEGTVSDISGKLKIPINTVDYNVKKLVKAGLIEKNSHFWSVKGKKMPVYKISNKRIIISPRRSVAKVFAWTIGLTGLVALTIRQFMNRFQDVGVPVMDMTRGGVEKSEEIALAGIPQVVDGLSKASPVFLERVENSGAGFISFFVGIAAWEWFLIGAWFTVFLFFAIILINERRSNK